MGSCPVLEGGCGGSQSSIGSRSGSISERRSIAILGREAGEGGLGLKSSLLGSLGFFRLGVGLQSTRGLWLGNMFLAA